MPELPEVHTTASDLNRLIVGKKIKDIWTIYDSPHYYGKEQIKDPKYFNKLKKEVVNKKVISVSRIAKNVLINLEKDLTIVVHMKMTGHLLYGKYSYNKKENEWKATKKGPLRDDKWNGWIRLVFTLSNNNHLALSDLRKFAKIILVKTSEIHNHKDFKLLGPDPILLKKKFTKDLFKERINLLPKGKIKTVLMNQNIISGIGNIYSDEALWLSNIHPEKIVSKLKEEEIKNLYKNCLHVLKRGINFKGDSMSDYRIPSGEKGEFQNKHNVYQRLKEDCKRKKCNGKIQRIKVGGRSSHFCPICQKKQLLIKKFVK